MPSSAYYHNSDPSYWPQNSVDDGRAPHYPHYPPPLMPQRVLHEQNDYQPVSPQYAPPDTVYPTVVSPQPSLLRDLLTRKRNDESDVNKSSSVHSVTRPQPIMAQAPCHPPPYAPSSCSDESSPVSTTQVDSSSHKRYPPGPRSTDISGACYEQRYQSYPDYPVEPSSYVRTLDSSTSPPTCYKAPHHEEWSDTGAEVKDEDDNSKHELSNCSWDSSKDKNNTDTTDDVKEPETVHYAWMKSNFGPGES